MQRACYRYSSFICLIVLALSAGCGPASSSAKVAGPGKPGTPPVGERPLGGSAPYWEVVNKPERALWTQTVMDEITGNPGALLDGARDMTEFCPNYNNLNSFDRARAWTILLSAIAKFESGFNPVSRYRETTMGTDPVTGQPVWSEGLLQLSYQDVQSYPECNEFDWQRDRLLAATDPNKTILDPQKNLRCGTRIMRRLIARNGLIALSRGYWAVLIPGGRYNKLPQIKELTKAAIICR